MIFLNPAVLLGLLAASIPVLIHLFNLRKLQRIEFSTLSFLKELQKNRIRKIKLKQWLLLLLRVLIIAFIVLSFARPALKGIAIGGTTSAAKTSAVFIIDDTFSMSVVEAKGSYFNQAKAAIQNLLSNFQEGDEAALVKISSADKDEITFTSNLVDFKKSIESLQISDETGKINDAIVKAANVLSGSNNFNKEIYLLTDFQKGKIAGEEELSNLSRGLNERIKLYSFNYSGKNIYNLGIDDIDVNTQIFEKNKPVNFIVKVTNYSNKHAGNVVVSLFINGERSSQQSVDIQSGATRVVNMESTIKQTGFVEVFAKLEDDDILQDNTRFTNLYIPEEIPVLIFESEPDDSKFVKLALTAADNEQALKVTVKNLNQFNSIDLNKYSVIFIIGGGTLQSSGSLKEYVRNGGGLVIMPGAETKLNSFNNIISSIGLPPASDEAGTVTSDYSIRFGEVDFNHPVFQNIFLRNEKKQIASPDIYHHFKLNNSEGRNIIKLADGSVVLSEYKIGTGKVLLFGVAPVLSWSSFPLKSIFVPILNKSAYYLSFAEKNVQKYFAGDEIVVNISGASVPQLNVLRPDKTEDIIINDGAAKSFIKYSKTSFAGIYKFYNAKEPLAFIAVNVKPDESITEYSNTNEFLDYLNKISFAGKFVEINKDEDITRIVMQARFGTELWKIFLLLALLLALVEMFVAKSVKKDMVQV